MFGRGEGGREGRGEGGEEAQLEWAMSGGQSTSHSAATPSGLWSCPISQRADRLDPAAWSCCRQLSGMCDCPIVAAPMASPASVTIDGGARLSLWTTGHEGACRGRVRGDVNGVQRECNGECRVDVSPRCPRGRKTCHQETLGYSSGHGGYGDVVWVESEVGEG